ncbi:MAG: glycosyltransferase family 2 protein [Bdellovibrionaceae bacterium]|nr:glycosyltransferase family 2 protein [Bdellovibrionales bacterium]MCB9086443.1 glycosyltransferase family 2 protein [Pseudobdellovibrionaceae bacterium]
MSVLSLVLPCHNEQEAIPVVLDKLLRDRSRIIEEAGLTDLEIIVVDDGSTDGSADLLRKLEPEIRFIRLEENQGYGRALKTGFTAARGQLLGFYDLDDTCQPEDLIPMVRTLDEEDAGMVCGNRLNENTKMPPQRYLGNWLYRNLTRALLKHEVQDCCTGMRVFSAGYREEFCQTLPDDLNFSLAMTIRFLKSGGTYREIPIQYHRRLGESKLSVFTDGPLFLWTLLRYSFQ